MLEGSEAGAYRVGKYRLVRRLAVGGMAEVFLARATGIGGFEKPVVLKRVLPHVAQGAQSEAMFLHEARLAATLTHPKIVQVYDVGRHGETLFFTMEYIHGESVSRMLRAAGRQRADIPLDAALHVVCGIAAALHYAHEKRGPDGAPLEIVHRDISHSNVIVRFDGPVKVVDFGIAKATTRDFTTRRGALKGKLGYMSPEQGRGEKLDRRSDIFSLGVMLFELTTGTRLFRADREYALLKQVTDPHHPIPRPSSRRADYPPELEAITMRAVARAPADRYQTADEMLADLEELARTHGLALTDRATARLMRRLFGDRVELEWDESTSDTEVAWHEWMSSGVQPAAGTASLQLERSSDFDVSPAMPPAKTIDEVPRDLLANPGEFGEGTMSPTVELASSAKTPTGDIAFPLPARDEPSGRAVAPATSQLRDQQVSDLELEKMLADPGEPVPRLRPRRRGWLLAALAALVGAGALAVLLDVPLPELSTFADETEAAREGATPSSQPERDLEQPARIAPGAGDAREATRAAPETGMALEYNRAATHHERDVALDSGP